MEISSEGVPINDLVSAVSTLIERVRKSCSATIPDSHITSAELILEVLATDTADKGIDFRVPFLGMKISNGVPITKSETMTVYIALQSLDQAACEADCNLIDYTVSSVIAILCDAIDRDSGKIRFASDTIDISFAITEAGSLALASDTDLAEELTQTLRLGLTFGSL